MQSTKKKAVILLSGGLDSSTCLAIAHEQGFETYALSFRYGQRHEAELEAARRIAETMGADRHVVAEIDLKVFGGSALTSDDVAVPKGKSLDEIGDGIPVTYVPARNTVFLSFATAWADVLGAEDIFIGVNALDYSGYPDCRPEFIESFEETANLGTRIGTEGGRIRIHTPLIALTKGEIVAKGIALGVDYSITRTCYDPDAAGAACGDCDACVLRIKGFADNGLEDPSPYSKAES